MSRLFNSATDTVKSASSPISSGACTLMAWYKSTSMVNFANIAGMANNAGFGQVIRIATMASGNIRGYIQSGANDVQFDRVLPNDGAWHCIVLRTNGTNSHRLQIDGGTAGTSTTTSSPTTLANFTVGDILSSSNSAQGRIAHVAVWNTSISDADVTALAGGDNPLTISAVNLVGYWPLNDSGSTEADSAGAITLTSTGADHDADNPTVDGPQLNPTVSSATVSTAGNTLSIVHSESVSIGAGGNGGIAVTASGGAVTATYSSGSGSTTLVYSLSRTLATSETVTIAYTQPVDGIEATSGGLDVVTYSGQAVTNNTVNAPTIDSVVAVGTDSIDISWTDVASNETSFDVQYDTASDFSSNPQTITINTTNTESTTVETLLTTTTYYFRIRANSVNGYSQWSETTSVTTLGGEEVVTETISSLSFLPSYSILSTVPRGDARLGEDWDLQLPQITVNDSAVFGTEIREVGAYSVEYLTIPTIVLPATFAFTTIDGTEVRYSFKGRPYSNSSKYTVPFELDAIPVLGKRVTLKFRAFKTTNGITSPLQGSRIVIAKFYVRSSF